MLTIVFIILFIFGFLCISLMSSTFSYLERIGFAFPLGLGTITLLMLAADWMHIPVTSVTCLVLCMLMLAAIVTPSLLQRKFLEGLKQKIEWDWINILWIALLMLAVYIEYANFSKCMYYPTFDRDSMAGFDTIGYVAAKEFTYGGISIFSDDYMPLIHRAGSIIAYQPMVQLSYMLVYLFDAETSKAVPALFYLSFLVGFYGLVRRASSNTAAMMATIGVLLTPEMTSMSALSATNVIQACVAAPGLMYVCMGFNHKEKHLFLLGFTLLAVNCWIRNEGILFVLVGGCLAAIHAVSTKEYKILILPLLAMTPKLVFLLYAMHYNLTSETAIIAHPFWDTEKIKIISSAAFLLLKNTMFYGLAFVLFPIAFLANIYFSVKKKLELTVPVCVISAVFIYFLIIYHVDFKWDSIYNVLAYSSKRYMFCFVPMSWFFICSCEAARRLFLKIEDTCGAKYLN